MERFVFRVDECFTDLDDFEGVGLAGPVLECGFEFAVGDPVLVPTVDGAVLARCTGFPLVRWGPGRERWVTITVVGVDAGRVAKEGAAFAERS